MKVVTLILFTLLIQLGLMGRALAVIPCCPENQVERHAGDDCDHDHDPGQNHTDDSHHDHHHASCVHSILIPAADNGHHALAVLDVESIRHPRHHQWPPDKPFLALEKPPLI